jgi:signal transduction histidine kinase
VLLVKRAVEEGRPYAMAFVDVRMPPGWDGVETTQKLWEIDPDVQVVICTAYSDYSWNDLFAKLAHRDGLLILKKPFDIAEALQLAHTLTEKWYLYQESTRKMEELERRVGERTSEWRKINEALQSEVAERKRTEAALQESHGALSRRKIELQSFYHTVSHELKTPLTSAREFASILLDGIAGPPLAGDGQIAVLERPLELFAANPRRPNRGHRIVVRI